MIITVDNYLAGKVITAEKVKITMEMEQLLCALQSSSMVGWAGLLAFWLAAFCKVSSY